jgi:predicted kinase
VKYIICRGCPGSGKTTWAVKYPNETENSATIRVNRDDARRLIFSFTQWKDYEFNKEKENEVTKHLNEQIKWAAKHNYDVIDDNTNLNPKYFEETLKRATSLGFEVEVKEFFDIPLDKLLERNLMREYSVPEDVVYRMFHQQMEIQGRVIKPVEGNESCILVDVDGTIADMGKGESWGRSPFEWHKVSQDRPRYNVIDVVLDLSNCYHIFFLSGRDGVAYDLTKDWLEDHVLPHGNFLKGWTLKLRKENDIRHDSIVKEELIREHVLPKYNIKFAIDDRKSICIHYRALGLEVWQVQDGLY